MKNIFLTFIFMMLAFNCEAQTYNPGGGGGSSNPNVSNATGTLPVANGGTGVASTLTTGNVLPYLATNPVTGATAEYPITDGTGTTVKDVSGNNNNGTLSATAPVWTGYGLMFNGSLASLSNEYITTPITTWKTAVIHACPAALPQTSGISIAGPFYSQFPTLMGASTGTDGIGLLSAFSSSNSAAGGYLPNIYKYSGSFSTTTAVAQGPCFTLAVTLDTLDHEYIDGNEIGYISEGASASAVTTSGNYNIGTQSTSSTGGEWSGSINYVILYPSVLTPTQVAQVSDYVNFQVQKRPGYPRATLSTSSTPQLICSGDSLTASYKGSALWCSSTYITGLNTAYNITGWGITDQFSATLSALEPLRAYTAISPAAGNNKYQAWDCTNDLTNGFSAAVCWASLQKQAIGAHQRGAKAIVATMISRVNEDTNKNAMNALIRAHWRDNFDALDDYAAIPAIGADGAYATTACFQSSDQTHLTGPGAGTCYNSLSGYSIVATQLAKIVNIMDGATQANPTITTSNAYTEAIGDNYTLQTPTAAATHTLIDCTGLTGIPRTIYNGSGTYSITVNTTNSQTITGSATISPNGNAVFTCNLTAASTGGNFWVRTQ